MVSVKSRKVIHSYGNISSYPYYNVDKINIYNEDGEDVSSKYPLFCQRVKDCVPSYKDVENDLMEANMSDTELYFGSEANYCITSMVTKWLGYGVRNKFVGLSSVTSHDLEILRYELEYGWKLALMPNDVWYN